MAFLSACVWLLFIIQRNHGTCTTKRTATCYSKELIYDPNTFTSSSTIQITSLIASSAEYELYFYSNQYQCTTPTLTIYYQQIPSFTVQYHQNYAVKRIQCNPDNDCWPAACVTNYILSNQTIASGTVYPIIINASAVNNGSECYNYTLHLNVNVTLFCYNNGPSLTDWSQQTTNRFKLWYTEITHYITYGDRPIYFGIIGGILLCICFCCCIACIRQHGQPQNVTTHPKPKYVKPKKLKNNNVSMDTIKLITYKSSNRSSKYQAIEYNELLNKSGIVYLQTRYYDDKQLQNITKAWHDNYKKGPKILFGDNYADKYRPKHKKQRSKSGGQSKVIGKYDRKYGFGITTTFDDAKEQGFNFTNKNFRNLIAKEFKMLHKHLKFGDVIIPYPTKTDLQERPQKYFKNGDYNSKQLIFHNLGTGISSLSFQNLLVVQQNIDKLKKSASAVIKVKQKMYDQPYYSDAEHDSDKIIEEEMDPFLKSLSSEENVHSAAQGELNQFVRGLLIFQTAWYSKQQMQHIRGQCKTKSDVRKLGKMVFGDNDADKFRAKSAKRQFFGGQASVVGDYDKLFGYGITTTFVEKELPEINNFMLMIDQQFIPLQQHLLKGYDVIIPKPRKRDVLTNKKNYYKNGKQVIFHNIGTGIASLSFEYVSYIQHKIDELKKYGRGTETVKYYNCANNDGLFDVNKLNINEHEPEIYHCPLCSEEQHYLIHLTNCMHSICEQCLRGYIYQHLIYEDNPTEQRFKCWAATIGKCKGEICLSDIRYTDDRCRCEQCKNNNSDTGTDTILDVERYKQFVLIMNAFNTKSKWNKTECPQCLKPFTISKPWTKKKNSNNDNEGSGYDVEEDDEDYVRKKTFFSKNMEHCNCCGEKVENKETEDMKYEFCENKQEMAITAYGGFNNCGVCNYYYCDKCRRNCFYEIEQRYTMRPPSPVQDAMMEFYALYPANNSESIEPFECCEICWYRYYCRNCPHCGYTFCAHCNSEWIGWTRNWSDKLRININMEDEHKLNDDLVDEKHGKHDDKYAKHSCLKAKAKMADIERKKKEKREKNKNELIQRLAKEKQEAEYDKKHQQYLFESQRKELEEMTKQNAMWKAKALESENKILAKEKNASQLSLKRTQIEKDRFRAKAEEEEKKAIQVEKENNKLRKKIGFLTVWQWHDNGANWKSYDYDTNKAIEKLNINEVYSYLCRANNQNYKITKTAKDNGTQINTKTNVERNIKRNKIERSLNVVKYPQWWNMNALQLESEPGSSLINAMYATPKLIRMNLNELPANDVVNKFYLTVKGYTIIKIECIQNQMLYDAYDGARSKLLKLIGNKQLNEKKLFHGTRSENVMKLIENEGFRKEFNKTAMHGNGTYFARDASYSVGYSSSDNGIYKMFECNVLCGQSHLGNASFELNKWPKKSNGSGLIYDSLVDNTTNPSIFVIHDDLRAYPMFSIHFKKN